MEKNRNKFMGRMFKYARESMKLTQFEASQMLNLSESYYKSVENGKGTPSLPAFLSLIEFYNLSADSILYPMPNDSNSLFQQECRLMSRCNDTQLQILIAITNVLLSNDVPLAANSTLNDMDSIYTKCLQEILTESDEKE